MRKEVKTKNRVTERRGTGMPRRSTKFIEERQTVSDWSKCRIRGNVIHTVEIVSLAMETAFLSHVSFVSRRHGVPL